MHNDLTCPICNEVEEILIDDFDYSDEYKELENEC